MVILTLLTTLRHETTSRLKTCCACVHIRMLGYEQVHKYRFRVSDRGVREIIVKIE